MKAQIQSTLVRKLFGLLCVLITPLAHAAGNWELGSTQYNNICTNCHDSDVTQSNGIYPATFTNGRSATYLQGRFNTGTIGNQMGAPHTNGLRTIDGSINGTVSDIAAYIGNSNFPTAALSPGNKNFDDIAVGRTNTTFFTLTNNGHGPLTINDITVSDIANFSVSRGTCGSSLAVNHSCSIAVTFQPQSVNTFTSTLTVAHNALGGSSSASLSGKGLVPLSVAPTTLSFTPATAPTGLVRTATITDDKGDMIRVCREGAATFSAPSDYSLAAPSPLGADGCVTFGAATPRRTISLDIRFIPGADGPRNANFTVQRVGGIDGPFTIRLQGNPGPYATLNASRLFDEASDPGVEVDNDNFLERSVTLYSRGSDPLVFTSSSFTISGTDSDEYTLTGGGCQSLSGLPSSSGSVPPSCTLTVRFNPSKVGRQGPASLNIDASGTHNSVTLYGLGFLGPRLTVARGSLPLASDDLIQFGTQTHGGLYPGITVTLANGGTLGDLEVQMPAPTSIPGFTLAADAGCASLVPAASCAIDVHFDPTAVQAYAATLVLQTRPAGSTEPFKEFRLNLQGQGSADAMPVLSWTDTSGTPISRVDFEDTDAGAPRTSRVRVYNDGPGGALLQLANVFGRGASNFILDRSSCPVGLALYEKTSCELVVQFAPGSAGLKTASIQMTGAAGAARELVVAPFLSVGGTGISSATVAALQLSSSTLTFANTVVGAESNPLEITLSNSGTDALNVTALTAAAAFSVQSKTCASVPFTLAPGNECTVTVTFQPQTEGDASGTLVITSDGREATMMLTGNGTPKADVVTGGCSMAAGTSATDPTLWALVLLAAAALLGRKQAQARARKAQHLRRN